MSESSETRNKAIELWNSMVCAVVDECVDLDLHPQDEGRDTEALVGRRLAEQVVALTAERDELQRNLDLARARIERFHGQLEDHKLRVARADAERCGAHQQVQ